MKNENSNRVLGRQGARDLTPAETNHVTGAFHTATVCTFGPKGIDGDVSLGEC